MQTELHETAPPAPRKLYEHSEGRGICAIWLSDHKKGDYEEDHLISLELGGDPKDPKNLWPESYKASISDGGARIKDKVEKYLNKQVCDGNMMLAEAQKAIVNDWYQSI